MTEDDRLVSDAVAAALVDDYETSRVATSAAAIERSLGGGLDPVLLDCTLPDVIDLLVIREPGRSCVPVVLASADSDRRECVFAPVWACIRKPRILIGSRSVFPHALSIVPTAIGGEVPGGPDGQATQRLQAAPKVPHSGGGAQLMPRSAG